MPEKIDLIYDIVKDTQKDVKDLRGEVQTQNGRIIVLEQSVKLKARVGGALLALLPPLSVAIYLFLEHHV